MSAISTSDHSIIDRAERGRRSCSLNGTRTDGRLWVRAASPKDVYQKQEFASPVDGYDKETKSKPFPESEGSTLSIGREKVRPACSEFPLQTGSRGSLGRPKTQDSIIRSPYWRRGQTPLIVRSAQSDDNGVISPSSDNVRGSANHSILIPHSVFQELGYQCLTDSHRLNCRKCSDFPFRKK
jgi:hypothetical protein